MTNNSAPQPAQWSFFKKIAFRFSFVFFLLIILLEPNDAWPTYDKVFYPFLNYFQGGVIWAAKHLLNIAITPTDWSFGASGGDSTFDYVLHLFIVIIAVLAATIWSYTGRKTSHYSKLFYWLLVLLRYFMAFNMVIYGVSKIFRIQFPLLTIGRLMERVGDMSPMGLAWTYMSYSTWFNYFTGFSELLCAGLLLFRRTTKLGAVVGIVLMINVAAINYCFDVCVKLTSTTLLLVCFFILIPDYQKFINFFLRNQATSPSDLSPHRFAAKWKNTTLIGLKYVLILYMLGWNYSTMRDEVVIYGPNVPKPPLYGLYRVETFVKNRDTLKPLTTDTARWNKFWINDAGYAGVRFMNDTTKGFIFKPDTLKHIIAANTYADTVHKFYLHYTLQKPDIMILQGQWKQDSIYVKLHKIDLNKFRLISRGFHMINEEAYNR